MTFFIICVLHFFFILVILKESIWRMLWPNTVMILYILFYLFCILLYIFKFLFHYFKFIFNCIYFDL